MTNRLHASVGFWNKRFSGCAIVDKTFASAVVAASAISGEIKMILQSFKTVLFAFASLLLHGCTEGPTRPKYEVNEAKEFGEEEKRAASVLSIGNTGVLEHSQDGLEQALICSMSIGEIVVRVEKSPLLNEQQQRALRAGKAAYDQRVATEKAERSLSDTALASMRQDITTRAITMAEKAQISVACLKALRPEDL